jgi:hypothetical protein
MKYERKKAVGNHKFENLKFEFLPLLPLPIFFIINSIQSKVIKQTFDKNLFRQGCGQN